MSLLPQNENNMFSMLRSNYTCISDEQAHQLAKMITQNNEVKNSGAKYSGTSFELYTSDAFISTVKSSNETKDKKKRSEIDKIIDEDSFPVKMKKTMVDKFADWLSGFEIPDDTPELTLEDMGVDGKEITLSWNFQNEMTIFTNMINAGQDENTQIA